MPAPLATVVNATAQDLPKYLDEIGRNGHASGRRRYRGMAFSRRREPEERTSCGLSSTSSLAATLCRSCNRRSELWAGSSAARLKAVCRRRPPSVTPLAWSMVHRNCQGRRPPNASPTSPLPDILKFAKFVIDESLPVRSEKREEVQKMKSPSSFNTHPRITEDA
jgi:hypothetical protein